MLKGVDRTHASGSKKDGGITGREETCAHLRTTARFSRRGWPGWLMSRLIKTILQASARHHLEADFGALQGSRR